MNNSQIQIYCDGGSKTGYGHISRSKALLSFLISQGLNSSIYGISNESNSLIGSDCHDNKDAKIIIFDSHKNLDKLILKEKNNNKTVITLDWFGKENPDYNIIVFPHFKPNSIIKSYVGFKYVIIRDEILILKETIKIQNKALVCIGGGDLLNQGHLASESLYKKGFDVTLIIGKSGKKAFDTKMYKVLNNPKNFSELLASSSFVVTNGGGCMFESVFLNIPTWALPQTKFENNVVNCFINSNSIVGQGLDSLRNFKIEKLQIMNNKNIIDGLGKNRIFKIINNLV